MHRLDCTAERSPGAVAAHTEEKRSVATKKQQRDRVRRREARVAQARATRQESAVRNRRTAVVVVVIAALVAALVWLSGLTSQPTSEVATGQASSATTGALECSEPPAVPGTAARLDLPDPATAIGRVWEATITTNCGVITADLDGTAAPQAVASFMRLAQVGFYVDSPCHRLLTGGNTVLQCGDPTGTGTGGPGYGFGVENPAPDSLYPRGTLAMARTSDVVEGTGSQFFVVGQDSTWDIGAGGYTRFGTVTGGLDIVDRVVDAGVAGGGSDGAPAQPISILSVLVTEKKV